LSAVKKWEQCQSEPYPRTLEKISEVTGKPVEWFKKDWVHSPRQAVMTMEEEPVALKHSAQLAPSKAKSLREVRRRLQTARDQLVAGQGQALEQGQTELAKVMLGAQREVLAALDELDKLAD
jgi:hypothetical protein